MRKFSDGLSGNFISNSPKNNEMPPMLGWTAGVYLFCAKKTTAE